MVFWKKELGGSVKINIQKLKSYILISVEDDGVGMKINQDVIKEEKINEKNRVGVGLANMTEKNFKGIWYRVTNRKYWR